MKRSTLIFVLIATTINLFGQTSFYGKSSILQYYFENDKSVKFTSITNDNFILNENDIIPFINYIPTSGNSGGVVWSLDYTWCNNGDTFSAPSTLSITTTTTNITNNYDSSDFTPISGTGMKISSSLLFRIYRNGTNVSDTYPDNIGLLSIGFKHQTLGLGSTQLSSK